MVFRNSRRQKRLQVERLLRRALNRTTVKATTTTNAERREEVRVPGIQSLVLAPQVDGGVDVEKAEQGLAGDLASCGLAAYVSCSLQASAVYVGLCLEGEPHVFIADVRNRCAAGGGLQRLGLELAELADPGAPGVAALSALAVELAKA